MITAAQLRAARGLLDWSRGDLSRVSRVSQETIKNIEHGTFRPQEVTEIALIRAFAAQDVEFFENNGVRIQKNPVKTFTGKNGLRELLDHVYETVCNKMPMTRHLALADTYALNVFPEYACTFSENMSAVPNLDAKCLIWEGDTNFPYPYCEYRWLKKENVWAKPFYIYGNNVVFVINTDANAFMAVSINSETLAKDMKAQFDAFWKIGTPPIKEN